MAALWYIGNVSAIAALGDSSFEINSFYYVNLHSNIKKWNVANVWKFRLDEAR